ncbi:MAG: hypothetical protein L3K17_02375 [Thermoplasmata archaeon]|nr:hypothetical protein [Thermoplasmata archaeon]
MAPPRFAVEIEQYLQVSGPTSETGLARHFLKWGATDRDVSEAIEWLVHERRIDRELDPEERYRARA